ncbi:MAG: hypothetical protein JWO62_147 [Acidimicrobiaceae bacterium]|nr:hypothetical protein [Acidimicrobiaceae bacterium]
MLSATLGGTFVLGAIPALRGLWDVSLAVFLLTTGYVALLIRFQQSAIAAAAASERAEKVVPIGRRFDHGEAGDSPYGASGVGALPPARPAFVLVDVRA